MHCSRNLYVNPKSKLLETQRRESDWLNLKNSDFRMRKTHVKLRE
jgi:hypothetical protein